MRNRKSKSQMKKDSIRYRKEVLTKCGDCKYLFNGTCEVNNTSRYANEVSCINFKEEI